MNKSSEKRNLSQLYSPPPPEDYSQNYCRLSTVIVIATIFIALEVIGGILSGSIAIISDAIHLVSDLLGFVFSILFLYLSKRGMDNKVTFGYHRMELLGALINIFIIWTMVLFIIYEATLRIVNKQFVKQPFIMLITASGGLLINIILFKILHGGSSHSHGLLNDHKCQHQHQGHQHGHQGHQHHGHQHHQHQHQHQKHQHKHQHNEHQDHGHNHKQGESCKHKHEQDHAHHEHNKKGQSPPLDDKIDELSASLLNKNQHANCKGHDHQHNDHIQKKLEPNQYSQHCMHQHEHEQQQIKHESIGMKSAIIHALSDLVQSVGVVVSAVIIYFFGSNNGSQVTQWNAYHLFDPIATYIFSILSLLATLPVIHNCYYLLMESAPNHIDLKDLQQECEKIEGVIDVHDIHVWDLKPGKTIMMAHVLAKEGKQRVVLMGLTDLCRRKKIFHSTFQVEQEFKNNNDYIRCHNDIH